jgi:hypothetical protein
MRYPEYAEELHRLLEQDQKIWRSFSATHNGKHDAPGYKSALAEIRAQLRAHSVRTLEILKDIDQPSLSNIGPDGAQAVSIMALHDSISILMPVLKAFMKCYQRDPTDTYIQAIPSMTDRMLIMERKPQRFGTMWDIDPDPTVGVFLPTVEDFEHVDQRREQFGIEPLRWPKSLAIPENEQPWLKRPLSELVMRDITDQEFADEYASFLD